MAGTGFYVLAAAAGYYSLCNHSTVNNCMQEAPSSAMINSFLLGMAYGVGGTAFGIAIRYVGFSLTYAIAVGISCVLATLLPPIVHGTLGEVLKGNGASFLIFGIVLGAAGIALCGFAGRQKEKDIEKDQDNKSTFSLAKGLPLCLLAGVLSALYGFSLDQGQPIADVAAKYGAANFQGNVIYIFSNSGAFVTGQSRGKKCMCISIILLAVPSAMQVS